jgi:hypothetical protein
MSKKPVKPDQTPSMYDSRSNLMYSSAAPEITWIQRISMFRDLFLSKIAKINRTSAHPEFREFESKMNELYEYMLDHPFDDPDNMDEIIGFLRTREGIRIQAMVTEIINLEQRKMGRAEERFSPSITRCAFFIHQLMTSDSPDTTAVEYDPEYIDRAIRRKTDIAQYIPQIRRLQNTKAPLPSGYPGGGKRGRSRKGKRTRSRKGKRTRSRK